MKFKRAFTFFSLEEGLLFFTAKTYHNTSLLQPKEAHLGVSNLSFLMLDIIIRASAAVKSRNEPLKGFPAETLRLFWIRMTTD